jgi:hypothetical protein
VSYNDLAVVKLLQGMTLAINLARLYDLAECAGRAAGKKLP